MPPTFAQIRKTSTREAVRSFILATLDAVGFQATSWQEGSVPFVMVETAATVGSDLYNFASEVAGGAYGETARGVYADLWAWDRYRVLRGSERFTTGSMVFTDHGSGPHSPTAGALVVALDPPDDRTWISTAAATIPALGSVTVPMRGSQAGARFNIPSGARLKLLSSQARVTVANPPLPGSQTWIVQAGADRESDKALTKRAPEKWGELSIATPDEYYRSKIRTAIPTITKVRVLNDNPEGPGTAVVVVATGAGPASAGDVLAANALLRIIRSIGAGATTARAAVAQTLAIGGVAYVAAAQLAAARAAVVTELAQLQTDLDIGETIYAAEVIRIVKSQPGVRNFVPSNGLVDTTPDVDAIVTLLNEIVWVAE